MRRASWQLWIWTAATLLFLGAWTELHHGRYNRNLIVDTPVYQQYGDAIDRGQVPYRDFTVEYPPGALPVFALPALNDTDAHADPARVQEYPQRFELLMVFCALLALGGAALALRTLGASTLRTVLALSAIALAPLLLGSIVLSRFDYWPAALTVVALAALAGGHRRWAALAVGAAFATKVYPGVLLPILLADAWRQRGRAEALRCAGLAAAAALLFFLPFLAVAPHGVWVSVHRQTGRPLQVETLGSAVLLAAHHLFDLRASIVSSFGSQNLATRFSGAAATLTTLLQVGSLLAIWVRYAVRWTGERDQLIRYGIASVAAFMAFGKVLSPQFMIWLIPLVPLVAGRRGLAACALLGAALVLTQLWFPHHYWTLVQTLAPRYTTLILLRDLALVALALLLVWPTGGRSAATRTL